MRVNKSIHGWMHWNSRQAGTFRTDRITRGTAKKATLIIEDEDDGLETVTVYQWRYRNRFGGWTICPHLYTEDDVMRRWRWPDAEYEKHAGPFEVPE